MVRDYNESDHDFILENIIKMDSNYKVKSNPFSHILILEEEEKMAFLDYSKIYEKIEINYIFTLDKFRNNGCASKLLTELLKQEYENITLEVRESNIPAINLYEKFGFKKISLRKNYYGSESAVLMVKEN